MPATAIPQSAEEPPTRHPFSAEAAYEQPYDDSYDGNVSQTAQPAEQPIDWDPLTVARDRAILAEYRPQLGMSAAMVSGVLAIGSALAFGTP